MEVTDELLSLLDVLVDGRFVEELKDISLRFRGSRNQRLIDLNRSRASGAVVLGRRALTAVSRSNILYFKKRAE